MSDNPQWLSIDDVRHVPADQWNSTVEAAKKSIRESIAEPAFDEYLSANVQALPNWVTKPVFVGLAVLALLALFISAGKQLAAADLVFGDLVNVTNRVSPLWVSATLIAMLLCGELGSLLFGLAAGIFQDRTPRLIFRVFSISSALVALGANIAITASRPIHEALVWQWLITLFVPLIVLGVGFAYENMLLTYLHARVTATRQYKADYDTFRAAQRSPERNPTYKNTLFRAVLSMLREAQPTTRRKAFDFMVATDPDFRRAAFLREFAKHSLTIDLEFDDNGNPIADLALPPVPSVPRVPAYVPRSSDVPSVPEQQEQPDTAISEKVMEVVNWYTENDPKMEQTVRDVVQATGTSVGTVTRARNYLKSNPPQPQETLVEAVAENN